MRDKSTKIKGIKQTAVFALLLILVVALALPVAADDSLLAPIYDDKYGMEPLGSFSGSTGSGTLTTIKLTKDYTANTPLRWVYYVPSYAVDTSGTWSHLAYEIDFTGGHYKVGLYSGGSTGGLPHIWIGRYNTDSAGIFPVDDVAIDDVCTGNMGFFAEFAMYYIGSTPYITMDFNAVREEGVGGARTLVTYQYKTVTMAMDDIDVSNLRPYIKCENASCTVYYYYGTSVADIVTAAKMYAYAAEDVATGLYDDGYSVGFGAGYADGYNDGDQDGRLSGYAAGLSDGKNTALEDVAKSEGVIWDILSMPFDLLLSVLNFDFLGINFAGFCAGAMTLALVVFVLKKVGVF